MNYFLFLILPGILGSIGLLIYLLMRRKPGERKKVGDEKVSIEKDKMYFSRLQCNYCKEFFVREWYWIVKALVFTGKGKYRVVSKWKICKECAPKKENIEIRWERKKTYYGQPTGKITPYLYALPPEKVEEKKEEEIKKVEDQIDQLLSSIKSAA